MSANSSTPASEVSRPPSKATRTALPAIGDEPEGQGLRPVPFRGVSLRAGSG